MEPMLILLILLYISGATSFFLFMFLKEGPRRTTKWLRDLLLNEEFVRETTKITHACLIRELIDNLVPVIRDAVYERIAGVMAEQSMELPEGFWTTLTKTLDGWYGNMQRKAQVEVRQAEGEARDAIAYAGLNQGNPVAMDAIMARVSAKSPILGALMQLSQQMGPSSQSRPGNGSGRY